MIITNVQVRDVVFQIEFSLSEVNLLKKALDNTTLNLYNLPDQEEKDALDSALKGFYSILCDAIEGLEESDED